MDVEFPRQSSVTGLLTLSLFGTYSWVIPTSAIRASKARVQETSNVTKKEIVKAISEELGLTQLKTRDIVQRTFDMIVDTLVTDGRIELRNFGVFEVKKRAARKARNPRTGDSVEVPSRFVVTFKPGKEMEERVLLMEQAEQRLAWETAVSNEDAGSAPSVTHSQNGHPAAPVNPNGLPPLRQEVEYRPPAGPAPRPQGGN